MMRALLCLLLFPLSDFHLIPLQNKKKVVFEPIAQTTTISVIRPIEKDCQSYLPV